MTHGTESAAAQATVRILVGRIVGLFGVDGWIKLESFTEPRAHIFKYRPWLVKHAQGELEIDKVQGREQGKGIVATVPGFEDRDSAASLIGAEIWIRRTSLPKAKRGEYYWADLEGIEVCTKDGIDLGRVSHLFSTGANDVIVVRGERERLIPFVKDVVEVDMSSKRITVDWDPEF
jgi:16S rRNA processing protein RimM